MSEKPRHARYANGTSDESVQRAVSDLARLERGQLNAADEDARYTPSGCSRTHYDKLRTSRDDLDYREWNESTGFWGIDRRPTGPGVLTEGQVRRGRRTHEIDDGF